MKVATLISKPARQPFENEAVPIALPALRGAAIPNSKPPRQERLEESALTDDTTGSSQAFCRLVADSLPVRRSASTS
jgi:hypothetical protein